MAPLQVVASTAPIGGNDELAGMVRTYTDQVAKETKAVALSGDRQQPWTIKSFLGTWSRDVIAATLTSSLTPIVDVEKRGFVELAFVQSLGLSPVPNKDLEKLVSGMLEKGGVISSLAASIVQMARRFASKDRAAGGPGGPGRPGEGVGGGDGGSDQKGTSSEGSSETEDTFAYRYAQMTDESYSLQLNINLASNTMEELLYKRKKVVRGICGGLVKGPGSNSGGAGDTSDLRCDAGGGVGAWDGEESGTGRVTCKSLAQLTPEDLRAAVEAPERCHLIASAEESFRRASKEARIETRLAAELAVRLASSDQFDRESACHGLGELGQAAELQLNALIERLTDASWSVRRAAQAALLRLSDDPAVARPLADRCCEVVDLATEPEAFVRRVVCEVLGRARDACEEAAAHRACVAALARRATDDDDRDVRRAACTALGAFGEVVSAEQRAALSSMLQENDRCVRVAVRLALARLEENPSAHLASLAVHLRDESFLVRLAACEAVGLLGQAALGLLDDVATLFSDTDFLVRAAACETLSRLGAKAAEPHLTDLAARLEDDNVFVRRAACEAFARLGEAATAHVSAIAARLTDEADWVRGAACHALVGIGKVLAEGGAEEAVSLADLLLPMLDDPEDASRTDGSSFAVRGAALDAMGALGKVAAPHADAVALLLEDEDGAVAAAASRAMERITGQTPVQPQPWVSEADADSGCAEAGGSSGSRGGRDLPSASRSPLRLSASDDGEVRSQPTVFARVETLVEEDPDLADPEDETAVSTPPVMDTALGGPRSKVSTMFRGNGGSGGDKPSKDGSGASDDGKSPGSPGDPDRSAALKSSGKVGDKTPRQGGRDLIVTLVAARGLRNADGGLLDGVSDPYCVCQLRGQPRNSIKTVVEDNNLEPVWNHEGKLVKALPGDVIEFDVFDQDFLKKDDLLGQASMVVTEDPIAFNGDLSLEWEGKPAGLLRIKVREAGALMHVPRDGSAAATHAARWAAAQPPQQPPPPEGDADEIGHSPTERVQKTQVRPKGDEAILAAPPPRKRTAAGGQARARPDAAPASPLKQLILQQQQQQASQLPPSAPAAGGGGEEGAVDASAAPEAQVPKLRAMKTMDMAGGGKKNVAADKAINAGPPRKLKTAQPSALETDSQKAAARSMLKSGKTMDLEVPRRGKSPMPPSKVKAPGFKVSGLDIPPAPQAQAATGPRRQSRSLPPSTKPEAVDVANDMAKEFKARRSACETLGRCGEAGAHHAMMVAPLLQDEDVDIRGSACEALGQMGKAASVHHEAVGKLLYDLATFVRSDGSTGIVQIAAMKTLASMGQASDDDRAKLAEIADSGDPDYALAALQTITQLNAGGGGAVARSASAGKRSAVAKTQSRQSTNQEVVKIIVPELIDGKLGIRMKKNDLVVCGFEIPEVEQFGWKQGDAIVAIQGQNVSSTEEFKQIFVASKRDMPLVISVARGNGDFEYLRTLRNSQITSMPPIGTE